MLETGGTLKTVAAGHVGFGGDAIPRLEALYVFAHLDHVPGIFVTEKQWELNS